MRAIIDASRPHRGSLRLSVPRAESAMRRTPDGALVGDMPADSTPAATTQSAKPNPAKNLYDALIQFAEANRAMLTAPTHGSGKIALILTFNTDRPDYRAGFGMG